MKRKRFTTGKKKFTSGRAVKIARKDAALSRINEHAAGIDIGAMSHFVVYLGWPTIWRGFFRARESVFNVIRRLRRAPAVASRSADTRKRK